MPVVLGGDPGERVLLYGTDGSTLRALVADSSGRLVVVGIGASGEVEVVQATPADLQATVTPAAGASFTVAQATPASLQATVTPAAAASFTVAQATPDNLRAGIYGRIASAWQRQPLQFGYGGVVEEVVTIANAAAGTNVMTTTAVPANRVHVITTVSLLDRNTAGVTGSIEIATASDFTAIGSLITLAVADRRYGVDCYVVLEAGETLRGIIFGATLNDDLFFAVRGYYFDLTL